MSVGLEKRSVVIESTSLQTVPSRKWASREELSNANLMILCKKLMWLVKVMRLSSIIDVSPPILGATCRRCGHVLFEVSLEEASIGWSHACAHSSPMHLEIVFA